MNARPSLTKPRPSVSRPTTATSTAPPSDTATTEKNLRICCFLKIESHVIVCLICVRVLFFWLEDDGKLERFPESSLSLTVYFAYNDIILADCVIRRKKKSQIRYHRPTPPPFLTHGHTASLTHNQIRVFRICHEVGFRQMVQRLLEV